MLRSTIIGLIGIFLSTSITFAGDISLSDLQVKKSLKAGKPYTVKLPYTKTGDVKVKEGCFLWTGEGPYCFPVEVRSKTIRAKLRTNNPNKYQLEGFVRYQDGGKIKSSNRVTAIIDVKG